MTQAGTASQSVLFCPLLSQRVAPYTIPALTSHLGDPNWDLVFFFQQIARRGEWSSDRIVQKSLALQRTAVAHRKESEQLTAASKFSTRIIVESIGVKTVSTEVGEVDQTMILMSPMENWPVVALHHTLSWSHCRLGTCHPCRSCCSAARPPQSSQTPSVLTLHGRSGWGSSQRSHFPRSLRQQYGSKPLVWVPPVPNFLMIKN